MREGVILLNFGEPAETTPEAVVPFLERIFFANAPLEAHATPAALHARCRQLAEQRAPGLIAEYRAIGGSPLNAQANAQADALAAALARRGHDAAVHVANQFADPLIPDVVARARADGVDRLVGLPVYPVCGPSTNVAALEELAGAVDAAGWDVPRLEVTGWHRHPDYVRLRADGIVAAGREAGLDLNGDRHRLVFSAHGTPMKYIEAGSRYRDYTVENCAAIAAAAGVDDYVLGYQNHGNRPIEWTQPSIDHAVLDLDADAVLVVPVSFMHEQSETLSELDIELRGEVEAEGMAFHRVPVPHDDPRFAEILADLVEAALGGGPLQLRQCVCRPVSCARCTNGVAEQNT